MLQLVWESAGKLGLSKSWAYYAVSVVLQELSDRSFTWIRPQLFCTCDTSGWLPDTAGYCVKVCLQFPPVYDSGERLDVDVLIAEGNPVRVFVCGGSERCRQRLCSMVCTMQRHGSLRFGTWRPCLPFVPLGGRRWAHVIHCVAGEGQGQMCCAVKSPFRGAPACVVSSCLLVAAVE